MSWNPDPVSRRLDDMEHDISDLKKRIVELESKGKIQEQSITEESDGKKIDYSVLIESGIDCEFRKESHHDPVVTIGALKKIHSIGQYQGPHGGYFFNCRPRMNHIHACPDGFENCPLPKGILITVYLRNQTKLDGESTQFTWEHHLENGKGDIIAFEITGLMKGYTY